MPSDLERTEEARLRERLAQVEAERDEALAAALLCGSRAQAAEDERDRLRAVADAARDLLITIEHYRIAPDGGYARIVAVELGQAVARTQAALDAGGGR